MVKGRRVWQVMALGVAIAGFEPGGGASAREPQPTAVAQVTRNDRADVTFELRPAAGGAIALVGRSGNFEVTKTVQSNGEFTIELATPRDHVAISVTGGGATVTRAKSPVRLSRSDASETPAAAARQLLAGSTAVVRFRAVAAALMQTDDRSHASLGFIIADATVGLLAGDVGAPGRVARLLGDRKRANVRPAGMAVDCFTVMETRMVEAWNDFGMCYMSTAYNSFYQNLCSWRWTIQVESYWFNFLSCTGFSF
jgi:hypothetical protein